MQNYIEEPGLLHDCLAFLSLCSEYRESNGTASSHAVMNTLLQSGITVPDHLSPLISRRQGHRSFISSVLIDGERYSRYEFDTLKQAMKNPPLLKSKYAEFYFPEAEPEDIRKISLLEYPSAIGLINKLEPSVQNGFTNILYHFDSAMWETTEIIDAARSEMEKLHRQFIEQKSDAFRQIQKPSVSDMLRAISGLPANAAIRFTLSLMDEERISFIPEEPDFFILGCRFSDALERDYKYCHLTPVTFIRDLGNEAKQIIFEALLCMRPMSAADMETQLHLSRNAVARNIKAMRECGVVTAERKGLSYYYVLNRDYINVLTERLEHLKWET